MLTALQLCPVLFLDEVWKPLDGQFFYGLPFSITLCRRALATRTRTFATGSDERLSRLGSRCWLNCSMGMQSSSTTAYGKYLARENQMQEVVSQNALSEGDAATYWKHLTTQKSWQTGSCHCTSLMRREHDMKQPLLLHVLSVHLKQSHTRRTFTFHHNNLKTTTWIVM